MSKVIYEFNTLEDRDDIAIHGMAKNMYCVLWDMSQELRDKVKYGTDEIGKTYYARMQETLVQLLDTHSVNLDSVS